MNTIRFIVRDTPNVLDLRPGDICRIGYASYRPKRGPKSPVQVFRDDFRWMNAWAPACHFLPLSSYLKTGQPPHKRDVVMLLNLRRIARGYPKPFLSYPLLKGEARMGDIPWRFESIGEAVYFMKSNKIRERSFLICQSQSEALKHLFT